MDVIPDDPARVRQAAKHLINTNDDEASLYLPHALQKVACEQCDSLEQKSNCLELKGDIAFRLSNHDLAFDEYRKAIECTPTRTNLRLKLVHRLRGQGRNRESLIEARKGRFAIPRDADRFSQVIQQMANDDLRQIDQRGNAKPPLQKLSH